MSNKICPGCGNSLPPIDGPIHRYMTSSPACWKMFGEILAVEYSSPELMEIHRLTVDTYAVQHPGDTSRQAIQSVGMHLARLAVQLDTSKSPDELNAVMSGFSARKAGLIHLARPYNFSMTIDDIAPFTGGNEHISKVREWAASAWQDWHQHHDYIHEWIEI